MLSVSKPVKWRQPWKRLFFGALLVAAGVSTFALGFGSWLSWVELGFGLAALGSALAHSLSGYPRWVSHKFVATEAGIKVYERKKRDPTAERDSLIPARVIEGVTLDERSPLGPRIRVETAFGTIFWKAEEAQAQVTSQLQALWRDVDFDDSPGWVESDAESPLSVTRDSISWPFGPSLSVVGTFLAQVGMVVSIVPLWDVAFGIPFALLLGLLAFMMSRVVRRWRELFGYESRLFVEGDQLHWESGPTRREMPLEDVREIQLSMASVGGFWVAEVNDGEIQQSVADVAESGQVVRGLFRFSDRVVRRAWIIMMPEHGVPEMVRLIEESQQMLDSARDEIEVA